MVEITEVSENQTCFKEEGNAAFKKGDYTGAGELYTCGLEATAVENTELRSVFLFNRACCMFHLSKFSECVTDCTSALDHNPTYCKALFRRALASEKVGKFDEAADDLEKLFQLDPALREVHAREYNRIVRERDEQFDREKADMMKELKNAGNSLLGHFGMSVDDFNFKKDPSTGNYSMSFSKNTSG